MNTSTTATATVAACLLALALTLGVDANVVGRAGCSIAINGGLPEPQPLLLRVGGSPDGFGFHLPVDASGLVEVAADEPIRLACPGASNYIAALGPGVREAEAVCVGVDVFGIDGALYSFADLACQAYPFHTARPSGASCHDGTAMLIEIGFELSPTEFVTVLEVCFDEATRNALWSRFDCVSGIGGYQSGFPRPDFIADNFYPGMSPASLYTRAVQKATLATLLGSTALADQYIHDDDDVYLARGHLTAKADFVYGSQHRATFHYVNVAPQWQTFNGANWAQAEYDVRQLADARVLDLVVYTGTLGVATLPDVDGVEQEIWLFDDGVSEPAIPVPRLYWKVAYEPVSGRAVALLGVNNPHVPAPGQDPSYVVCQDVCDQIDWLLWVPDDIMLGYSYCCEVDAAFREVVVTLPDFPVSGLLT